MFIGDIVLCLHFSANKRYIYNITLKDNLKDVLRAHVFVKKIDCNKYL